jgi:hypothetical protein
MLALAVTASGFAGLRCRMTGMVSFATCCLAGDADQVPEQSAVDDPGCCEHFVVDNLKPPAAGAAAAPDAQLRASPIAFVSFPSAALFPARRSIELATDPPVPTRPPLHLLHRSLLI